MVSGSQHRGATAKHQLSKTTCVVSTESGGVPVEIGGTSETCRVCLAIPDKAYARSFRRSEIRFGRPFKLTMKIDWVTDPSLDVKTKLVTLHKDYKWVFKFTPVGRR